MCMYEPYFINVDSLTRYTETTAASGLIDDVSGIQGDKVYIYDGTMDTVVFPGKYVTPSNRLLVTNCDERKII